MSFLFLFSVEAEVKLRPTVGQPVCLGVRHPSGTRDQFFFLIEIFFRQLRVCYFVALSLTRGGLLLLVLASTVPLQLESRGTQDHILLSKFMRWRAGSLYIYPPGTEWPRYTLGHWVPFPLPLTVRRAMVEVFYPASPRDCSLYMNSCFFLRLNILSGLVYLIFCYL
jgi:hypothetical protein